MFEPLEVQTFHAHEASTDTVTKVHLAFGHPQKKDEATFLVPWRIDVDDQTGPERRVAGVDAWQALSFAMPILELETKLLFRDKQVRFYYTREDAKEEG